MYKYMYMHVHVHGYGMAMGYNIDITLYIHGDIRETQGDRTVFLTCGHSCS